MVVTNEQFLFRCIENSTAGVVDWEKVANQCELPTKGAAAIKYKRMKVKFDVGDDTAAGGSGNTTPAAEQTPKKKLSARKSTPKKRKLSTDAEEDGADGSSSLVKEESPVKDEPET